MGGTGGIPFYYGVEQGKVPQSGTVVRSFKVWYYDNRMIAILVALTDGNSKLFGKYADKDKNGLHASETFVIADGETVKSLTIWGSSFLSGRCGGFELITDQNRSFSFDAGRNDQKHIPGIGSGVLVGVFGFDEEDINCLGFALLRRANAALINMHYDTDTSKFETAPRGIKTITYDNSNGTVEQEFTFDGSTSVTTGQSWSVTAGIESSIEAQVKAGIPLIDQVTVKVSIKLSVSGTYSRSTTKTTTRSFTFPVKVPAGKHVKATARIYEGNINMKYTAQILYALASGKSFSYNVTGDYTGITASEADVTIVEF